VRYNVDTSVLIGHGNRSQVIIDTTTLVDQIAMHKGAKLGIKFELLGSKKFLDLFEGPISY
jgi:hypothetical protein